MDRRLIFVLQRAARAAVVRVNTQLVEAAGISVSQLGTLSYLAQRPGCSMTDIAELLDLNKSGVSGMVNRLERAGWLRREVNPNDARGMQLYLSAKGEKKRRDAGLVFRQAQAEITGGFAQAELDVVLGFLNAIVDKCAGEPAPASKAAADTASKRARRRSETSHGTRRSP